MKITHIPIDQLKEDPENPNYMPPVRMKGLKISLEKYGMVQPIVIDEDNMIINGHQKLTAAKEIGMDTVPCVRLSELNREDKQILQQALNKITDVHTKEKDLVIFKNLIKKNRYELEKILNAVDRKPFKKLLLEKKERIAEKTQEKHDIPKRVKKGDTWKLGNHTLYCGNAHTQQVIDSCDIILTDPPYSSGGWRETDKHTGSATATTSKTQVPAGFMRPNSKITRPKAKKMVAGDTLSTDQHEELIIGALEKVQHTHLYVCTDWRMWHSALRILAAVNKNCKMMIIWDKMSVGVGLFWRPQHELIAYGAAKGEVRGSDQANIIKAPRSMNKHHPTEKPVELMRRIIANTTGNTIYDPFAGSGTTLIAAEIEGKSCTCIELDPEYCDTILARWEKLTNQKAKLA